MLDATDEQRIIDIEHLRLLRLAYFISAGVSAFFGAFGLLYMGMGLFMGAVIHSLPTSGQPPPPAFVGFFFAAIGAVFVLFGGGLALLKLRVAKHLRLRTAPGFCKVIAAISCIEIPYGTAVGICTFSVLSRPSVEKLFTTNIIDQPPSPAEATRR